MDSGGLAPTACNVASYTCKFKQHSMLVNLAFLFVLFCRTTPVSISAPSLIRFCCKMASAVLISFVNLSSQLPFLWAIY